MSVQVKRRRDTAANIAIFTPAQGELVVDTTNNRVIVGDGATAGGFAAAKLSEVLTGATALTQVAQGANGAAIQFQVIEQTVTLAGGSTTASLPIPANCIVFAVGTRVLTAVAGAPSFGVGVSGDTTRFGGALNIAVGSTNFGIIGPLGVYAATNLVVTATSGSFTAGQLRLSLKIMLLPVSTS